MKRIKDSFSNQKLLRYGSISVFALCVFFSFFYWVMREFEQTIVFDAESFNEGWSVSIDDEHFDNVDLTDFSFPVVSTGTKIVLENKLPFFNLLNPVLRIYTLYCTADIYLDGKIVYVYGHDLLMQSKNVGCGFHVTSLHDYSEGTPVKIVLNVTEPRSFTALQPVWIESADKTFSNMLSGKLFMMFSSIFLFVLGLVTSVVSLVFLSLEKKVVRILSVSQALLWLGLYQLYANRCMVVFFSNYSINSWMEHVTLYCTNFAVLVLFHMVIARKRYEKNIALGIIYAFAVYCTLILLLDFSGIMHLPTTRFIQFVFLGVELVFCFFVCIKNVLMLLWRERLPSIAFLFMLFFMFVDFIRYPIQKYLSLNMKVMQGSPMSFGVLVFVTIMAASFLFQVRPDSEKKAMKQIEEAQLRLDYQTGFLNTFALNEYLKGLDQSNNTDFSVIMLSFTSAGRDTPDLFSLEGAEVLTGFTSCINKVFCEKAKIAYTGEAEFCMVASELRKEDIHRMLISLDEMLFAEIQKHPRYQYSMASGSALRSEVEFTSNLLPLAKERMRSQKEGFRA